MESSDSSLALAVAARLAGDDPLKGATAADAAHMAIINGLLSETLTDDDSPIVALAAGSAAAAAWAQHGRDVSTKVSSADPSTVFRENRVLNALTSRELAAALKIEIDEPLLAPFATFGMIARAIRHGAFLSSTTFVPRDVFEQSGARITGFALQKEAFTSLLTAAKRFSIMTARGGSSIASGLPTALTAEQFAREVMALTDALVKVAETLKPLRALIAGQMEDEQAEAEAAVAAAAQAEAAAALPSVAANSSSSTAATVSSGSSAVAAAADDEEHAGSGSGAAESSHVGDGLAPASSSSPAASASSGTAASGSTPSAAPSSTGAAAGSGGVLSFFRGAAGTATRGIGTALSGVGKWTSSNDKQPGTPTPTATSGGSSGDKEGGKPATSTSAGASQAATAPPLPATGAVAASSSSSAASGPAGVAASSSTTVTTASEAGKATGKPPRGASSVASASTSSGAAASGSTQGGSTSTSTSTSTSSSTSSSSSASGGDGDDAAGGSGGPSFLQRAFVGISRVAQSAAQALHISSVAVVTPSPSELASFWKTVLALCDALIDMHLFLEAALLGRKLMGHARTGAQFEAAIAGLPPALQQEARWLRLCGAEMAIKQVDGALYKCVGILADDVAVVLLHDVESLATRYLQQQADALRRVEAGGLSAALGMGGGR